MFKRIGLLILLLLMPIAGNAAETPRLYSGVRSLGMGNAFITLSDDANALFFNPAGLNDIKHASFDLIGVQLEVGKNSLDAYSDYKDFQDVQDNPANSDAVKIQASTKFLQGIIGENQHVRASTFPNVTFKNFSIGSIGSATTDLIVRNRSNPSIKANINLDYGPVAGFAFSLFEKRLQLGLSAKYIKRAALQTSFTAIDIATDNFDPVDQFEASNTKDDFAFDVGMKFNPMPKNPLKPSFALVVQNITDLDFEEYGKISQTVNIGVGIRPTIWKIDTALVFEWDDVAQADENDIYKRIHLGLEMKMPYLLTLRTGLNQGWVSYGVALNLWILQIEAASYEEELGVNAGQRGDRRYVAMASLGWHRQ